MTPPPDDDRDRDEDATSRLSAKELQALVLSRERPEMETLRMDEVATGALSRGELRSLLSQDRRAQDHDDATREVDPSMIQIALELGAQHKHKAKTRPMGKQELRDALGELSTERIDQAQLASALSAKLSEGPGPSAQTTPQTPPIQTPVPAAAPTQATADRGVSGESFVSGAADPSGARRARAPQEALPQLDLTPLSALLSAASEGELGDDDVLTSAPSSALGAPTAEGPGARPERVADGVHIIPEDYTAPIPLQPKLGAPPGSALRTPTAPMPPLQTPPRPWEAAGASAGAPAPAPAPAPASARQGRAGQTRLKKRQLALFIVAALLGSAAAAGLVVALMH